MRDVAVPPQSTSLGSEAREAILAWYAAHGRQLAFRTTTDPWAILVSEVMAQQTQATRAAAYWETFMARFPDVGSVAIASPADVLRVWAGLGYDRRALALRRAAQLIVERHDGHVPASVADLEALPGVGPYTARAVAALAFGQPVGAVDVNVRRVLGRITTGSIAAIGPAIQAAADASAPSDQPARWTHALMDLGATVCRPRAPSCAGCPARPWCIYPSTARAGEPDTANPTGAQAASAATPFPSTNRWLRGRILHRLRSVSDGTWVPLDERIGRHDRAQVRSTARSMASDGLIEIDDRAGSDPSERCLHARLALT